MSRRLLIVCGALGVLVLGFCYFAVTLFQVWRTARDDGARRSEAIVVLGAAQFDGRPSPVFAARLDHAADLYGDGIAPLVVVTGGKQTGDRFTEASAGAEYLHDRGVADEAILREVQGRSTYESIQATERFLAERDIDDVVIVTDPFHSLRARLIAGEVGLDAATSPTRNSPIGGWSEWRRFVGEAIRIMIGRIVGFERIQRVLAVSGGRIAMISRSPAVQETTRSGVV